ncbi:MAG: hypothetical protein CMK32_07960 [Porticoccaceae bacterium]|nr:hypothetical protein [Porticoccaceae bacterium]
MAPRTGGKDRFGCNPFGLVRSLPQGIRKRTKHQIEAFENDDYEPIPAMCPTNFPAGSEEKISVLQQRSACGQSLWHPEDNSGKDDEIDGDFEEYLALLSEMAGEQCTL